jgi:hypothetical protein
MMMFALSELGEPVKSYKKVKGRTHVLFLEEVELAFYWGEAESIEKDLLNIKEETKESLKDKVKIPFLKRFKMLWKRKQNKRKKHENYCFFNVFEGMAAVNF